MQNVIKELSGTLDKISAELSGVDDSNFHIKLGNVNSRIEFYHNLKAKLDAASLAKFKKEYDFKAKHIQDTFDNMIHLRKMESQRILRELELLENQKKIANYRNLL